MQASEFYKNGSFFTVIDGKLTEIEKDPEDTTRKVRLLEEAFASAMELQKSLRKPMKGYKPDLTLVCSALIAKHAKDEDAAKTVIQYFQKMITTMDE